MKSILIALILAPCLLWSCKHKCQDAFAGADKVCCRDKYMYSDGSGIAYGYDQQGEYIKISQEGRVDLYKWEGHLWRPVELKHSDECTCGRNFDGLDDDGILDDFEAHDVNKYRTEFKDSECNLIPYGWLSN